MKILINNQEHTTNATSLEKLVEELALPSVGVAIAIDNKLILKKDWSTFSLKPDMELTIIKAVYGG